MKLGHSEHYAADTLLDAADMKTPPSGGVMRRKP